MLLSEILFEKAIEEDNMELHKLACEIQFTDQDKDILEKQALWGEVASGLLGAAKGAMKNPIVRNAVTTGAVGAGIGAIQGGEGNRVSGAVKGGLIGAAIGGGTSLAKAPGSTLTNKITDQAKDIASKATTGYQGGVLKNQIANNNISTVAKDALTPKTSPGFAKPKKSLVQMAQSSTPVPGAVVTPGGLDVTPNVRKGL